MDKHYQLYDELGNQFKPVFEWVTDTVRLFHLLLRCFEMVVDSRAIA